jgi:DNA-binding XRE family transcriptional regulator
MQTEQHIRQAIAIQIISYRNAHDLTQKAFGKLIGKNRYVIAKYENKKCTPPLVVAVRIAELIGVSIYQLIIQVELNSHSCEAA